MSALNLPTPAAEDASGQNEALVKFFNIGRRYAENPKLATLNPEVVFRGAYLAFQINYPMFDPAALTTRDAAHDAFMAGWQAGQAS